MTQQHRPSVLVELTFQQEALGGSGYKLRAHKTTYVTFTTLLAFPPGTQQVLGTTGDEGSRQET